MKLKKSFIIIFISIISILNIAFAANNTEIYIDEIESIDQNYYFKVSSENNIKSIAIYMLDNNNKYTRFYTSTNINAKEKTFMISKYRLSKDTKTKFKVVVTDDSNNKSEKEITANKIETKTIPAPSQSTNPSTSTTPTQTTKPSTTTSPSSSQTTKPTTTAASPSPTQTTKPTTTTTPSPSQSTKTKTYSTSSKTKPKSSKGDGYTQTIKLNGKTFKLYKQYKGSYASKGFNSTGYTIKSGMTMSSRGCGPTSLAIVLSGYNSKLGPYSVAQKIRSYSKSGGKVSTPANMAKLAKAQGRNAKVHTYTSNYDKAYKEMRQALLSGHQIVLYVGKKSSKTYWKNFTNSGYHFISVLALDESNNKAYVGNAGISGGWFKLSTIVKARGNTNGNMAGWVEIW